MGPPGVGKGTQAVRLSAAAGVPHISAGILLREAVTRGTPVGRKVRPLVESGQLVPDEVIGDLIAERLRESDVALGFVLDGFPRTLDQVGVLDRLLDGLGMKLDRVLLLVAPEEEIVRRLGGRRVCPACEQVYHVDSRPPASPGVCDRCGSALGQRRDDTASVVRQRLLVYRTQTLPVAEVYRSRGLLHEVDGTGTPDAVFERLTAEVVGA